MSTPTHDIYFRVILQQSFVAMYTVNRKKTWHFIFDYNFG